MARENLQTATSGGVKPQWAPNRIKKPECPQDIKSRGSKMILSEMPFCLFLEGAVSGVPLWTRLLELAMVLGLVIELVEEKGEQGRGGLFARTPHLEDSPSHKQRSVCAS